MNNLIDLVPEFFNNHRVLFILLAIWTLVWKGVALWKASGLRQKSWFIALLIINTFGILEIIYLFIVTRNQKVEVIEEIIEDAK